MIGGDSDGIWRHADDSICLLIPSCVWLSIQSSEILTAIRFLLSKQILMHYFIIDKYSKRRIWCNFFNSIQPVLFYNVRTVERRYFYMFILPHAPIFGACFDK